METLEEEKIRLTKRLEFLNVHSRGRDRILERLSTIEYELSRSQTNEKAPQSYSRKELEQIRKLS